MNVVPSMESAARGIMFVLLSACLFPVMDAIAKYLGDSYPIAEIVWARYVFHVLIVSALLLRTRVFHYLKTARLGLQVSRAALLMAATVLFFTALKFIPLANAIAINFTAPFLVVGLSIPMLGERVGRVRWAVAVVGLLAVLVVIRPGFDDFRWASLLVVCSAACYALYQIVTRRIAAFDHPYTTLLYTGVLGALCSSVAAPFVWIAPSARGWAFMIAIGAVGGLSQFFLIRAFHHAPASLLAPFSYVQIVVGTAISYLWFGDSPDRWTIVGAAIIVACGLALAYRESRGTGDRERASV
ncbi:MAG: DMT family transporter [Alphaproteobacteria bacterium]